MIDDAHMCKTDANSLNGTTGDTLIDISQTLMPLFKYKYHYC